MRCGRWGEVRWGQVLGSIPDAVSVFFFFFFFLNFISLLDFILTYIIAARRKEALV